MELATSIGRLFPSPPANGPHKSSLSVVPGLFLLTFVASAAFLGLFLTYIKGEIPNTCSTVACTAFAKLLKSSVNDSIAPCDNFGSFVCQGWRRKRLYSVRQEHYHAALATMSRLTESADVPPVGQNALQQVAAFYRSCHLLYTTNHSDTSLVKGWLVEAGVVWPARPANPNVLSTLVYLALRLSLSSIIDIDVPRTRHGRAIVLLKPALSFYHLTGTHLPAVEQRRLFRILVEAFSPEELAARNAFVTFEDLLRIEAMIANLTKALASSHQEVVLEAFALFRTAHEWNSTIARYQQTGYDVSFRSWYPGFVEAFARLWKENGEEETHLLVSWHAVWFAAYFALGRFPALSAVDHGLQDQHKGSWCLVPLYLALGDVSFASYSAIVFPPHVRRDVKNLVLSVREAFTRSLSEDRRFTGVTNALAGWGSVKYVFSLLDYGQEAINLAHGPIPGLPDLGAMFALNWRTALQASRHTDQTTKHVLLSGTLFHERLFEANPKVCDFVLVPVALTYPMYDMQATGAIKYGGLGSHVALASARIVLGMCGHTGDDGTADSRQVLTALRQCLEGDTAHRRSTDGNGLVEELLALFFLLDAYSRSDNREKRRLEALPGFSSTQLFFLTWCFMRCAGSQSTRDDADPCSPVLRHVKEFSEVFECAQGTRLNPARRCELFPHRPAQ